VSCLKIELSLSVAIVRFVKDGKKFFLQEWRKETWGWRGVLSTGRASGSCGDTEVCGRVNGRECGHVVSLVIGGSLLPQWRGDEEHEKDVANV
jgi:hypothetical protein